MTSEEWKRRCAAWFVRRAETPQSLAEELAAECFRECESDGGFLEHSPEDAADTEMSYWTD